MRQFPNGCGSKFYGPIIERAGEVAGSVEPGSMGWTIWVQVMDT
jgi:hypothetical protein